MTNKRISEQADQSNMRKNPDDWVSGDEPMTGAQRSYLKTLCEEAKQPFDDNLTKAQASKRIDELHRLTRRLETAPSVNASVAATGNSRA
ncbi:MAG TPA: DUF3072 domain-containing protein [Burkholderiaceae bacterium]|nr:DUF3072 domain-containing protein [Burkholderiaceae bacterium]